ncbi:MAG: prolyl oligopeptidase family serine peptidase [Actinomycetes bacterium]
MDFIRSAIAPIEPARIAAGSLRRSELRSAGDKLLWLERRPNEEGRSTLVSRDASGQIRDLEVGTSSIGGRVYEYGGGSFCTLGDGDQRIAVVEASSQAIILSDPFGSAVPVVISERNDLRGAARGDLQACGNSIIAIREVTSARSSKRAIVRYGLDGSFDVLHECESFLAAPRVSPDGTYLAWLAWEAPDMPWDAAELWVASLTSAGLKESRLVLGGKEESVAQPVWLDDHRIAFAWERGDWWQAHVANLSTGETVCLWDSPHEVAPPLWVLGERSLAVDHGSRIALFARSKGQGELVLLDGGRGTTLLSPLRSLESLVAHGDGFAALGNTERAEGALLSWSSTLELLDPGFTVLAGDDDGVLSQAWVAHDQLDREVHGLLSLPAENKPRGLIVFCHGGPTAGVDPGYNPAVAFFLSHGYGVLQAAYAGSTGYGRAYRERLDGAWGIQDVEDVRALARSCAQEGLVDPDLVFIRGGSAGGFTALNALRNDHCFRGAVSWYGVSELSALAKCTHDFEAHYLERLVGLLPEDSERYQQRSPAFHGDEIKAAVLLLQGLDDPVVPPSQSRAMAEAIEKTGGRVTLLEFPGERHGFRRAESLELAFTSELAFYDSFTPQLGNES